MTVTIQARVKLVGEGAEVIVRKTLFGEDGKVDKKYGLSETGDWIEVPEYEMYPEECLLPVKVWDSRKGSIEKEQ